MSIWHKSVENLLVISAEEGKKRILGALCSLSLGSASFLLLEEVFCLSLNWFSPQSTNARKLQSQGRCLSPESHVARGSACYGEQLPPCKELQDTAGGSYSWYALVLI